jgi:hypothetical protein
VSGFERQTAWLAVCNAWDHEVDRAHIHVAWTADSHYGSVLLRDGWQHYASSFEWPLNTTTAALVEALYDAVGRVVQLRHFARAHARGGYS